MSNWTRAHDAHIARECEGLEVRPTGDVGDYWVWSLDMPNHPVSRYYTDPAATIRAAEAWRKNEPGRWYEFRSGFTRKNGTEVIAMAQCFKWAKIVGAGDGESALAQALYRATGGPA